MLKNNNITNMIRTKNIALIIIVVTQIFSFLIIKHFFNILIDETNIKILVEVCMIILCIIIDIIFYIMHIYRLKYFIDKEPIECTIEDLILVSYGYTERAGGMSTKEYRLYPVVKANDKLYFTYGNYCICHYNQRYAKLNGKYTYIEIFRKDNSKVEIGDKAYLYIRKELNINVEIDNNMYKLNKQKEYFNNRNPQYDINILNKLNFFEGIIV